MCHAFSTLAFQREACLEGLLAFAGGGKRDLLHTAVINLQVYRHRKFPRHTFQ
jgi:hypothetical protein